MLKKDFDQGILTYYLWEDISLLLLYIPRAHLLPHDDDCLLSLSISLSL